MFSVIVVSEVRSQSCLNFISVTIVSELHIGYLSMSSSIVPVSFYALLSVLVDKTYKSVPY